MKRCLSGMLIVAVLFLGGCAQPHILEKNGIMSIYGVDVTGREQLRTTSVFYKFGSKSAGPSRIVTGEGKTLAKGEKRMNYKLGFELQSGSIGLEIFGKKTAEKGLINYLKAATRDPVASSRRLLAVSDTTAEELITQVKNESDTNVNKALSNNIDVNTNMNILPKATMHEFQHDYYHAGSDPALPILAFQDQKAKLAALALFKGDKLAGKIPVDQAFYINAAEKTIHGLRQEVKVPLKPFEKYLQKKPKKGRDHFYTVFNIKEGTNQTKLVDPDNRRFHTQLDFRVNLLELTKHVKLNQQDAVNTFEKEVEKVIKQEYTQLVTKLQELNVDPIGYGRIYKAQKRDGTLTESEWRDKFPDITVDVDVNVDVLDPGITP